MQKNPVVVLCSLHKCKRQKRGRYFFWGKNCRFFSNIEQMCDALRISTKTGYKLLHEGKIPAMKIGRSYRIPKAHLFTYLQICGQHCRAENRQC